jgi:biotin carboxylase
MNKTENEAPCVLILAPHGSYRTSDFIQAAERQGIKTLIASEGKHSIISAYAQGIHLDFTLDEDSVFEQLKTATVNFKISGVIATDDFTTTLAARLASHLDLPHNNPDAVRLTQRKDLARDCLARHGISVPVHRRIDLERDLQSQLIGIDFPVVVKPVALSASRGVIRADDRAGLENAITRVQQILRTMDDLDGDAKRFVLIEEFISGTEVAIEAMLTDGHLNILTVFDKPDPMEGPYFEETYYIMPTGLDISVVNKIGSELEDACRAYGLQEGPIHAECRIRDGVAYIIEIAARTIGGLCGRLLNVGTGYSLEELVLNHAMGRQLDIHRPEQAAGVLMIPIPQAGVLKRIEGLLDAQRVEFIEDVNIQIREGHELVPLPEGASYLGFIFSRAPMASQALQALRDAHEHLRFIIAPVWKLQAGTPQQVATEPLHSRQVIQS